MIKTALVTGAAKGIGRTIALTLAQQGFDVAVHYHRSETAAQQTVQDVRAHQVQAIALPADVSQPQAVQTLVDTVVDKLGGLSVVVNNVGNYFKKPIDEMTIAEWHEILDTNLNATFYVTQAALPHLKAAGWGRIINLGFAGAQNLVARTQITPYAIAKTGVILYTKALAKQLASHRITANVVAPGVVETSVSQPVTQIPIGRMATVAEVARVIDFLIAPEAGYYTGQVIEVAGGWNL
ncbi:bifunctional dihydropteridine reductase/dihydrofolate reductase TmpR [Trichothermofontia sichuanensis B231]|uniref:bifunctional dihydropteridine reductase/dihydrofolate reductase TmpR n=1 Tax=Trichothermofontia sichuanensis TaxID=3045816 RepID=UPI002247D119|nr:bifunctional dihydropteridine reductase/dihydrofolate reductase TmpR [Trichothermofontia sichuanensis]UZQ54443.1 bifunctional dihydropteridine reductase/dihydrofolate reductase TmpR [Trichothermofontia sichuanensis B231]